MKFRPDTAIELIALEIMGNNMLRTGSGARTACQLHGKSRQHESLHNSTCGFLAVFRNSVGKSRDTVDSLACDSGYLRAIIFVNEQICHFPLGKTDIFCHHVAETRGFQFRGSGGENFRIGNDNKRLFRLP